MSRATLPPEIVQKLFNNLKTYDSVIEWLHRAGIKDTTRIKTKIQAFLLQEEVSFIINGMEPVNVKDLVINGMKPFKERYKEIWAKKMKDYEGYHEEDQESALLWLLFEEIIGRNIKYYRLMLNELNITVEESFTHKNEDIRNLAKRMVENVK